MCQIGNIAFRVLPERNVGIHHVESRATNRSTILCHSAIRDASFIYVGLRNIRVLVRIAIAKRATPSFPLDQPVPLQYCCLVPTGA